LTKNTQKGFLGDDLNRRILNEYLSDSRMSFREVARRLDVAPGTIVSRMKQAENLGIIEKYTAKLNHKALGLGVTAIIRISIAEKGLLQPDHVIYRRPGVFAVYGVTGDTDAIIIAKFGDTEKLYEFTQWLNDLKEVKSSHTNVVLTTGKEDYNSI
jgi:Lrp/AsnC family transcriptional regulator for asnA, asnC and gidA